MAERLKVLISAYACEPNKGSEPEVGWQLAIHMARLHDVTVITRANNQPTIEAGLAKHDGPRPNFIYYDLPAWVVKLKKRWLGVAIYYFFWQLGVRLHMRGKLDDFDLIHHATFNSFRHPGFWWFCRTPVVLGPLGGGQICPWRFLPWFRKQIFHEIFRSLSVVNSYLFPHIYLSFLFADKILIANADTVRCVPWLFQPKVERMLETALTPDQVTDHPLTKTWQGFRMLWISRLDKLKGGELAIRAFALALSKFPGMTLTILGGGREERALHRIIEKLDIKKYVDFRGRVPKDQISTFVAQHDAFVFTSLRDTSGNVVLEAMGTGLPVITFNHHGVAEITTDETALRVPITTRLGTVRQLGEAMLTLARSPERCRQLGEAGRRRVIEQYLWEPHTAKLSAIYQKAVGEKEIKSEMAHRKLRVIFSPKGLLMSLSVCALIGVLVFFSLNSLNRSAQSIVLDTLPGLSYAGEANFNLSQSFNRTLLMILTEDPVQRARYKAEMDVFSGKTTAAMEKYERAIFDESDRKMYQTLTERRGLYLAARQEITDLLEQNKRAEADAKCKSVLLPAYEQYKQAGEALLQFNIRAGQAQGQSIMATTAATRISVAVVGIALFLVGFLFGFFGFSR